MPTFQAKLKQNTEKSPKSTVRKTTAQPQQTKPNSPKSKITKSRININGNGGSKAISKKDNNLKSKNSEANFEVNLVESTQKFRYNILTDSENILFYLSFSTV
jgi:hypothetical protein